MLAKVGQSDHAFNIASTTEGLEWGYLVYLDVSWWTGLKSDLSDVIRCSQMHSDASQMLSVHLWHYGVLDAMAMNQS